MFLGSDVGGFVARLPVSTALRINIRLPQMIGLDAPCPGRSIFHLMLVDASHRIGGLPCFTTPFPICEVCADSIE